MTRPIYDEQVDFDDESPNSTSHIAKDVANFLAWASYPEHDERKKMGLKALTVLGLLLGPAIWWKRYKWSYLKTRKVVYKGDTKL